MFSRKFQESRRWSGKPVRRPREMLETTCPRNKKNVLVHTSIGLGSASPPIEFEVTRNMHMANKSVPFTVTAMFKDPPIRLIGEAWRILLHATDGKQLLPQRMQECWKKHVKHWSGKEPVSDSYPGAPATCPPLAKSARTSAESSALGPGSVPGDTPPPGSRPSSASQSAGAWASSASPLAAPAAPRHPPGGEEHESAEKRARAKCLTTFLLVTRLDGAMVRCTRPRLFLAPGKRHLTVVY